MLRRPERTSSFSAYRNNLKMSGLATMKRAPMRALFSVLPFFTVVLLFTFFFLHPAFAYTIVNSNTKLTGDFVLSPAKVEVNLDPGATTTRTISITNRVDKTVQFAVDVEDFEGTEDPNEAVKLLGDETGPYSLKDFLHPEIKEFTLKPGEEITLPVLISIPKDAEPGGLYGSVLVRNIPDKTGGAQAVSRLGALFFVRVNGATKEEGQLKSFRLAGNGTVYTGGPFSFEFLYQNTGNVHLIPYGMITVYNTFGSPIKKVEIEPYFALPSAIRYREITWDKSVLLGHYKAVIELNRGYGPNGGIIDTQTVSFWVLPWKWIVGAVVAIFVIILIIYLLTSKLEIRVKK